jgi:4-amino-4-deoxy-L-arabinose transferase-like glycosyltransferase
MNDSSARFKKQVQTAWDTKKGSTLVALLLMIVSLGVILHTWTIYDQTWDENFQIARGMDWLMKHNYRGDSIDPPLPPVMVALGPYALGAGALSNLDPWHAGNAILARGNYHHILCAARAGTLMFFLFAAYLVWSRGREWFGEWGGCLALGLFVLLPGVMAHSSLATTDASMFAMFFWAVDRLWRFLQSGTTKDALLMGLAAGLAMVCKMTATPCLVAAVAIFLLLRWYRLRRDRKAARIVISWPHMALAFCVCWFVVWGTYFFSVGSIVPPASQDREKLTVVMQRHHMPATPVFAVLSHLPAPEFFEGLRNASTVAKYSGHSWLLGKERSHGTRWFFPVILAVKLPIPFTLLFLLGLGLAVRALWLKGGPLYWEILVTGAVVPFLLGVISGVNLGSRHVFGMLPFAALLAVSGVLWLWQAPTNTRRRAREWVVIVLLVWFAVDAAWAASDPLPWYNELALLAPDGGGWFEPGSDFDWGQDLKRLAPILAAHHVQHFSFAYFGSADLSRAGLPPCTTLKPGRRVQGWVAISGAILVGDQKDYGWLDAYRPVAKAGKTMAVYWIPPMPSDRRGR